MTTTILRLPAFSVLFFFVALLYVASGSASTSSSSATNSCHATANNAADSTQDGSASSSSPLRRPPFVSHLTKDDLRNAMQLAKTRHAEAVQTAMDHYPLDHSLPIDQELVDNLPLKTYSIHAPGALPDFADELPRHIFVTETPLLTSQECAQVIADAEAHFEANNKGEWSRLPSGQYNVAGFWIKDVPKVYEWFVKAVRQRLLPLLQRQFPEFVVSVEDMCVDNAYLFKYTPETGGRTDVHTDSGCLSFTIALNDASEYHGGGTWFDALAQGTSPDDMLTDRPVLDMPKAGMVTIRPGGVKHCGQAVEEGVRYIIGGFCLHRRKPETVRQLLAQQPPSQSSIEAAMALNPQLDSSYNLLAYVLNEQEEQAQGEAASKLQKRRQDVLEYCLENVHPYSGDVAYALGTLYQHQLEQLENARDAYVRCLRADPLDVEALLALMTVSADLGDTQQEEVYALQILSDSAASVASSSAKSQAYANLGVLKANTPQEMDCYQKALTLEPDRFAPRYSLACALATAGRWKEACHEFRTALKSPHIAQEHVAKCLTQLYVATTQVVQLEWKGKTTPPTQQEQMDMFGRIMGEDNFKRLLELKKQGM